MSRESLSPSTLAPRPRTMQRAVALHLLALAGPMIASTISRTVMSFVDFLMVSELGTAAQAAVMPAGILLFCLIALGMGTMTAVNTFVSQSLGREQPADCARYTWQGLYLSLVMGLLVLPLWGTVEPFFAWVGHAPEVQRMEVDYARIGLLGVGPAAAAVALSNFFNGIHRPGIATWSVLLSNVVNLVLNYALIFGHWGAPRLGIAGAAWGTALATAAQTAFLLACFLHARYHREFSTRATWRVDLGRLRRLLVVGLPVGVQFIVDVIAWTIFTLFLVGRFGTVQLAANNLAFKLLEVSFMPAVGLGMALTAAVGKAIGAGRHDLARQYVRWGMLFSLGYMGLVGAGLAIFRIELVGLLTDDPAVIRWGGPLLLFCALFQVFDATSITMGSALRGAGDTHFPAVAQLVLAITLFLGGGYAVARLMPQWGSFGPWGMATLYIMAVGVVYGLRYLLGPWERINLHEETPAVPLGSTD